MENKEGNETRNKTDAHLLFHGLYNIMNSQWAGCVGGIVELAR